MSAWRIVSGSERTPVRSLLTDTREWIETDGLGGFASGPVVGPRSRRYHGLLLAATTPPTGRFMLVNGLDALVETPAGRFPISSQRYLPDAVHPDGAMRIDAFEPTPWPRWRFRLEDGTVVEQEVLAAHGTPAVAVTFRLTGAIREGSLAVRLFLSGRDYHALHHENPAFRFEPVIAGERMLWHPYPGVPGIAVFTNGRYEHAPLWYRNILYTEERARGLDHVEDLAAPGVLRFDLGSEEAVLILSADLEGRPPLSEGLTAKRAIARLRASERRRRDAFPTRLHRAADAYVVRRGGGRTLVAGYPWFTDWGRDTFIALRGLCLSAGRLDEAGAILLEWSGQVSEGMLPNRFPDRGDTPEYNAVDASLWFVVAVHEFLRAAATRRGKAKFAGARRLGDAVQAILDGYERGTRYGIRLDEDGLLAAGEPGVQLTWMDAKVGDWVVTPRIGKPVEVQALWLNALAAAPLLSKRLKSLLDRGRRAFEERFWNAAGGYLYDVVDVDHKPGTVDATFRPNQVLAVGGLPLAVLEGDRARRVVDAVEDRLLTPLGLRTLAPGEPRYLPRYEGGPRERDAAYHQGTVWPWLLGPFVEAWVRVRGGSPGVLREARARFLDPLLRHLDDAGIGHISEIADGDPPHTPRGCPFQAWSVGEALRLAADVLAETRRPTRSRSAAARPPSTGASR